MTGVQTCALPIWMLDTLAGTIPVVLPSKLEAAREALPAVTEILALQVRSIPSSLAEWLPAATHLLIGVASRWPDFLKSAHTMLIAAGFPAESLVLRDARRPGWQRGLKQTAAVVCDTLTAKKIPGGCRVISFAVLAEGFTGRTSPLRTLHRHSDLRYVVTVAKASQSAHQLIGSPLTLASVAQGGER